MGRLSVYSAGMPLMVVTGANTGIGRVTAEKLAAGGAHVLLACRSEEKTAPVVEAIRAAGGKADFVPLDLAHFESVRAGADRILAMDQPIDVLVDNAGLAPHRGASTRDGFEAAFGTNHLGHFLLTVLLAPRLRAAKAARIVVVSSGSHYRARGIDFDAVRKPTKSVTGVPEYEVSKLANVLFVKELARRIGPSGVRSYAVHPGVVASDAWRRVPWPFRPLIKLFMISEEDGARTTLHCATSPEVADHDGRYYDKCKEKRPNKAADDADLARALWEKSAEWTGADLA